MKGHYDGFYIDPNTKLSTKIFNITKQIDTNLFRMVDPVIKCCCYNINEKLFFEIFITIFNIVN